MFFEKIGPVISVRLPSDPAKNSLRYYGFVEFANEEAAQNALKYNGVEFYGRSLKIRSAHD